MRKYDWKSRKCDRLETYNFLKFNRKTVQDAPTISLLIGDATKAKTSLGWEPRHTLSELVSEMVTSDIALFRREVYLQEGGFGIKSRFE